MPDRFEPWTSWPGNNSGLRIPLIRKCDGLIPFLRVFDPMAMVYTILANLVAASHVAYVFFVVFGQLYIFLGWILRWTAPLNFWFRAAPFTMMAIVVAETLLAIQCPLTTWEDELFRLAEFTRSGVSDPAALIPVRRDFIGDIPPKLRKLLRFSGRH